MYLQLEENSWKSTYMYLTNIPEGFLELHAQNSYFDHTCTMQF